MTISQYVGIALAVSCLLVALRAWAYLTRKYPPLDWQPCAERGHKAAGRWEIVEYEDNPNAVDVYYGAHCVKSFFYVRNAEDYCAEMQWKMDNDH